MKDCSLLSGLAVVAERPTDGDTQCAKSAHMARAPLSACWKLCAIASVVQSGMAVCVVCKSASVDLVALGCGHATCGPCLAKIFRTAWLDPISGKAADASTRKLTLALCISCCKYIELPVRYEKCAEWRSSLRFPALHSGGNDTSILIASTFRIY